MWNHQLTGAYVLTVITEWMVRPCAQGPKRNWNSTRVLKGAFHSFYIFKALQEKDANIKKKKKQAIKKVLLNSVFFQLF